ncbi:MAG: GntR family transcriptional regulator [Pseudomonadota bacterium]|nr:GntR family transcriptional regulator [Pseudomonadota bacterium]
MNVQQSITKRNTRAAVLLAEIEAMIIDGSLTPGERLDEMVLAKKFGVSRTPVREAIRSLTAIGLVQNAGRQGAAVAEISVSMLIEMFELMAVLEGMCAQLAARRATDDERSAMFATHELLEKTLERGDHKEFYKVNLQFHDQLYEASHTQYLAGETLRLRRRLSPYRMRVTYQPGRMRATLGEHWKILNAVNNGDSEGAMEAALSHMRLIGNQLEDFIASLASTLKK